MGRDFSTLWLHTLLSGSSCKAIDALSNVLWLSQYAKQMSRIHLAISAHYMELSRTETNPIGQIIQKSVFAVLETARRNLREYDITLFKIGVAT